MIRRSRDASRDWQAGATVERGTVIIALGAAALSGIVVAALAIMVESSPDDRSALVALRRADSARPLCSAQTEPPQPLPDLAKR
jgi:hypothetical protein